MSILDNDVSMWIDYTILGSKYEQQIEVDTGRYRHRLYMLFADSEVRQDPDKGWEFGPAPDVSFGPSSRIIK